MRAFLRWIGRTVGSAVTIVLVIILFPYISRFASKLMPDESGSAIKASAILAENLERGSRLETLKVEIDGVLNYDIQAAFIGSVANISASYKYAASFGIDLQKVVLQREGNEITFILPQPELIQDSLTPNEVYRDDFWYPGFSDHDYEKLMENERLACREHYLSGEQAETLWHATVDAFEQTISAWLRNIMTTSLTFHYEHAEIPAEES